MRCDAVGLDQRERRISGGVKAVSRKMGDQVTRSMLLWCVLRICRSSKLGAKSEGGFIDEGPFDRRPKKFFSIYPFDRGYE